MKKVLSQVMVGVGALVILGNAYAVEGEGTANARVVAPITISPVLAMEFGNIIAGSGGSITLAANSDTPSISGVSRPGASQGGTAATRATFNIGGEPNFTYTVSLPESATLLRTGGTETMSLDTFVSSPTTSAGAGQLNELGAQVLYVGARLTVGSAQVAGSYTGTFAVTVAYN